MYIPEYTRNYPQISQDCPKYPNISQKISQNCSMNVASCASTKVQELAQRLDERLRATRERMEEPSPAVVSMRKHESCVKLG